MWIAPPACACKQHRDTLIQTFLHYATSGQKLLCFISSFSVSFRGQKNNFGKSFTNITSLWCVNSKYKESQQFYRHVAVYVENTFWAAVNFSVAILWLAIGTNRLTLPHCTALLIPPFSGCPAIFVVNQASFRLPLAKEEGDDVEKLNRFQQELF